MRIAVHITEHRSTYRDPILSSRVTEARSVTDLDSTLVWSTNMCEWLLTYGSHWKAY